ncbi:hypothetical protein M422DRAFT_779730 [Sphaerobolus stellatus SS14]|uniref:MYND-type domain-containing protein n=1 Tax=Sphaerobolus stellatus (strain SS14) TaxID=990650 RepID=A0A0C9V9T4_SPHS4|nr:hypothetical protein M422DRAFT_779730 [Sphaerobolus stellatus SS14]
MSSPGHHQNNWKRLEFFTATYYDPKRAFAEQPRVPTLQRIFRYHNLPRLIHLFDNYFEGPRNGEPPLRRRAKCRSVPYCSRGEYSVPDYKLCTRKWNYCLVQCQKVHWPKLKSKCLDEEKRIAKLLKYLAYDSDTRTLFEIAIIRSLSLIDDASSNVPIVAHAQINVESSCIGDIFIIQEAYRQKKSPKNVTGIVQISELTLNRHAHQNFSPYE